MNRIAYFSIGCLIVFSSCAPKISTSISKKYYPLDYREKVIVFGLQDSIPDNSEEIGTVKIGDTGFSTNCGWDVVIDKAKMEARKAGGNAIKITDHIPPSFMGSSCHRIKAKILKVGDFNNIPFAASVDSSLLNADYALLHIYRQSIFGALVCFDLHLGDTVLCRVCNKWKKTIKIRKEGLNILWARTEVKEELPINIQLGHEYFIRCSITIGAFVGHPKIELVNNQIGRAEFQSIKSDKSYNRDKIVLTDGREIECTIYNEDDEKVYITVLKDRKEIKTWISKTRIESIQRVE